MGPTQFDEFEPPPCLFPNVPLNKKQRFFPTVSLDLSNFSFNTQPSELHKSLTHPDNSQPHLLPPVLSDQTFATHQPPATPRPQRSAKTAANSDILLSVRPQRKSRKCSSNNQNQLDLDLDLSDTGPTIVTVSNDCDAIIDINEK